MRYAAVVALLACVGAGLSARADNYALLLEKARQAGPPAARPRPPARPPSPAEAQRGFLVYQPRWDDWATSQPDAKAADAIRLRAARDETRSALLAVGALADQKGVAWKVSAAPEALAGLAVEVLPFVDAPLGRRARRPIVPLWITDAPAEVAVPAGLTRTWLVRVRVSKEARAGERRIRLACTVGGAERAAVELAVEVLPFALADPHARGYVVGAFCTKIDYPAVQFAQMKAHHIEAIQTFWGGFGADVLNEGGRVRMDFTIPDRAMAAFKQAGLRGPVVLALGNDHTGHFERDLCRAFDLPMQPQEERAGKVVQLASLTDPRVERRLVEALGLLFGHAKEAGWPEIVIIPYDEPTERLMPEHRRMVKLFRDHFPKVRLYGVCMNELDWAKQVADTDILCCNGDAERIVKFARGRGLSAWTYGHACAGMGYTISRWLTGLYRLPARADGRWFWCYDYFTGDPWDERDGDRPDSVWVICWPPIIAGGPATETLAYEGFREGIDDLRYAMTLEGLLAGRKDATAEAIRGKLAGLTEKLSSDRRRLNALDLEAWREQVIPLIVEASK